MRIGCLQFAPGLGDVNKNLDRADAILSKNGAHMSCGLDLLVLPELAFTGSNFRPERDILPHLEPSASGITSLWARTAALKYGCIVMAGYPEKADLAAMQPNGPEYYESSIMISPDGETIANYNGRFAEQQSQCFLDQIVPNLGKISVGQCTDLGKSEFSSPSVTQRFARHAVRRQSNIVVLSMAWETAEEPRTFSRMPNEPDMDSLTCWVRRLEPLIRKESDEEVIVVLCNRTGSEVDVTYAGTSAVLGIKRGEVLVYGIMGRSEKNLLVVDTENGPIAKLVYRPESEGDSSPSGDKTSTDGTEDQPDEPITPDTSDKASESAYDLLDEKHSDELLVPKFASTYPTPMPPALNPEPSGTGQPVRPRITIPSSNLVPSEGDISKFSMKSADVVTSASSNSTVRPLEARDPCLTGRASYREYGRKGSVHDTLSHVRKQIPATPTTPFEEDFTPISASCLSPRSKVADPNTPDIDGWRAVPCIRERYWPAPKNSLSAKTSNGAGRHLSRASMRPGTPAVTRTHFHWPRISEEATAAITARLQRSMAIAERTESPKSRHASHSDLKQKAAAVMSSEDFSIAAKHLQSISDRVEVASQAQKAMPERETSGGTKRVSQSRRGSAHSITIYPSDVEDGSGPITILASPSILQNFVPRENYVLDDAAKRSQGDGEKALRLLKREQSRQTLTGSDRRTCRPQSPENRLSDGMRGRKQERSDFARVVPQKLTSGTTTNLPFYCQTQGVPGKANGILRKVQSQQTIRNVVTEQRHGEERLVKRGDRYQDRSRMESTETGKPQRRQRSSSQGVLPKDVLATTRRDGVTSWPISSEYLRLSASIIHKKLIDSFAQER